MSFWTLIFYFIFLGLTETCAASFIQVPDVITMSGTVGPPLCNIDARLESVPELGYDALDKARPRGEICIRGKTVFAGYYKRDELTNDVMDKDGWFHTGKARLCPKNLRIVIHKNYPSKLKVSQKTMGFGGGLSFGPLFDILILFPKRVRLKWCQNTLILLYRNEGEAFDFGQKTTI